MKRTTICRFSCTAALCAAAFAVTVPLSAQDTLVTVQDSLANPDSLPMDTVLPMPVSPLAMQGQRVHLVQDGETLWTLAEFYLGDPLLWPEIYRINTLVVEDPHWIFPGEELMLVPPDTTMLATDQPLLPVGDPETDPEAIGRDPVAQQDSLDLPPVSDPELEQQVAPPPPPPSSTANTPTIFRRRAGGGNRITVVRQPRRRNTGRPSFYAAGFLTEGDDFPWSDVLGPVGESTLSSLPSSSAARIFHQIRVRIPNNTTYRIGDSLLVARLSRNVSGWGRVVVPTGLARIVAVAGRDVRAEIETQFGRVADGQVALPVEPYRDRSMLTPVPVENGMSAEVIEPRDQDEVMDLGDVVFIDRGRRDGLVPGDVFNILAEPDDDQVARTTSRVIGLLEIVHVRERSASAQVLMLSDIGLMAGTEVRLVAKMPS